MATPIHCWPLDEPPGIPRRDYIGGKDLAEVAGRCPRRGIRPFAACAEFPSASNNTILAGDLGYCLGKRDGVNNSSFEVEVWFWNSGNGQTLCGQWDENGNLAWCIDFSGGNIRFRASANGSTITTLGALSAPAAMTKPGLNCFVVWYDAVNGVIGRRLNNASSATTAFASGMFNSTAPLTVGGHVTSTGYGGLFRGAVAMMTAFDGIRSDGERTASYNAGMGTDWSGRAAADPAFDQEILFDGGVAAAGGLSLVSSRAIATVDGAGRAVGADEPRFDRRQMHAAWCGVHRVLRQGAVGTSTVEVYAGQDAQGGPLVLMLDRDNALLHTFYGNADSDIDPDTVNSLDITKNGSGSGLVDLMNGQSGEDTNENHVPQSFTVFHGLIVAFCQLVTSGGALKWSVLTSQDDGLTWTVNKRRDSEYGAATDFGEDWSGGTAYVWERDAQGRPLKVGMGFSDYRRGSSKNGGDAIVLIAERATAEEPWVVDEPSMVLTEDVSGRHYHTVLPVPTPDGGMAVLIIRGDGLEHNSIVVLTRADHNYKAGLADAPLVEALQPNEAGWTSTLVHGDKGVSPVRQGAQTVGLAVIGESGGKITFATGSDEAAGHTLTITFDPANPTAMLVHRRIPGAHNSPNGGGWNVLGARSVDLNDPSWGTFFVEQVSTATANAMSGAGIAYPGAALWSNGQGVARVGFAYNAQAGGGATIVGTGDSRRVKQFASVSGRALLLEANLPEWSIQRPLCAGPGGTNLVPTTVTELAAPGEGVTRTDFATVAELAATLGIDTPPTAVGEGEGLAMFFVGADSTGGQLGRYAFTPTGDVLTNTDTVWVGISVYQLSRYDGEDLPGINRPSLRLYANTNYASGTNSGVLGTAREAQDEWDSWIARSDVGQWSVAPASTLDLSGQIVTDTVTSRFNGAMAVYVHSVVVGNHAPDYPIAPGDTGPDDVEIIEGLELGDNGWTICMRLGVPLDRWGWSSSHPTDRVLLGALAVDDENAIVLLAAPKSSELIVEGYVGGELVDSATVPGFVWVQGLSLAVTARRVPGTDQYEVGVTDNHNNIQGATLTLAGADLRGARLTFGAFGDDKGAIRVFGAAVKTDGDPAWLDAEARMLVGGSTLRIARGGVRGARRIGLSIGIGV